MNTKFIGNNLDGNDDELNEDLYSSILYPSLLKLLAAKSSDEFVIETNADNLAYQLFKSSLNELHSTGAGNASYTCLLLLNSIISQ